MESTGSGTSAEDQTKASMRKSPKWHGNSVLAWNSANTAGLVLELYATEIQMYSELKDSKKMKVCSFVRDR